MRAAGSDYSCGGVRKPHRSAHAIGIALAAIVLVGAVSGCDAPARRPFQDPFFDEDDSTSLVSGDMDKDEAEWRKQMAREHNAAHPATKPAPLPADDPLLTDDPPKAPEEYGDVAKPDATAPKSDAAPSKAAAPKPESARDPYSVLDDDVDAAGDPPAPPPTTFWGKVQAAAQSMGRASFAAMTILVTLGMMVAPYFIAM